MHIYQQKKRSLSATEIQRIAKCSLEFAHKKPVSGLSTLDDPLEGTLVFVSRRSGPKGSETELLASRKISALIGPQGMKIPENPDYSIFSAPDPYGSFLKLVPEFFTRRPAASGNVHPTAIIGESCSIDPSADIGAYSVLGDNVTVGAGTTIFPHVVIYEGVTIGKECIIHSGAKIREFSELGDQCYIQNGAVIGSDGFGYVPHPTEGITAVPQVGVTRLMSRVDVGANSCVDRAAFGITHVGVATKMDNQVQVGHNVSIGDFSIVCAQVGLAGSSHLGKQVTMGGQSGVADHVRVGDQIRIGAKGGVIGDLQEKGDYLGFPAVKAQQWRRQLTILSLLVKHSKKLLSFLKGGVKT